MFVRLQLANGCDNRLQIFRIGQDAPGMVVGAKKLGVLVGARKLAFFISRGTGLRGVVGTGQPPAPPWAALATSRPGGRGVVWGGGIREYTNLPVFSVSVYSPQLS